MKHQIIGYGEIALKSHIPAIMKLGGTLVKRDGEVVSICTPNYIHVDQAIEQLDLGKKVILEKPVAITLESVQKLLAHPKVDQVAICYQRRFDTQAKEIKLHAKAIKSISVQMYVRRDAAYWATWRSQSSMSGGGALINIFIHYFDLLYWWLGPEYTIKFAKLAKRVYIDQFAYIEMDFNGIPVEFTGSSLYSQRDNSVIVTYKDDTTQHYNVEDATHYDVYDQFLNHNNKISVEEAIHSLKMVMSIYEYDETHG